LNKLVLRLSFVGALLMFSWLACGVTHAQSPVAPFVHDSGLLSIPSLTVSQFPATDASLIADPSPAYDLFRSPAAADPGNLSAYTSLATASFDAVPAWPASSPLPQPAPRPYYSENPNQWQLGIAFALVRFRSSVYYASAPGFNSSLAYWWKEWVAIEGSVTTAFAPPVFANEHFRYLSYGAGPKFSFGHGRLEPWAHALVGGVHLVPQTAASGKNGFEFTMGGGVDYVINDVISAKAGVDYLGTHMFGQWQSSAQVVAGFSFRF
jgi:hypothetical protein